MKFVEPLYRDLYNWVEKKQPAIDTFKAHRSVDKQMAKWLQHRSFNITVVVSLYDYII